MAGNVGSKTLAHGDLRSQRRSRDNAPKSVISLFDMGLRGIPNRKLNDAPGFECILRGGSVGMKFLQNSIDSRMERFVKNAFLLGS